MWVQYHRSLFPTSARRPWASDFLYSWSSLYSAPFCTCASSHYVFERGDHRTRDVEPLFGELHGQIAGPVEDSQGYGAYVGGKVGHSPEVVEPVELILGLVRVAGEVLGLLEQASSRMR